jgi:hypothetical protein
VTLDASTGQIFCGVIPSVPVATTESFKIIFDWVEDMKTIAVMCEVKSVEELQVALNHCSNGTGVYRLDEQFMTPGSYFLDQLRLLLMSNNKADRLKHSCLLTDAISAHMIKIVGLNPGKALYVKWLAPSLCSRLCMSSSEVLEFCQRNTLTVEEIEKDFNNVARIRGHQEYFMEAKYFSFLQKDAEGQDDPTNCTESHICDACRSFMSSPVVVSSIVSGIVDAANVIKGKLPDLIFSVELMISDSFGDDEIDLISEVIAPMNELNVHKVASETIRCNIGLHVHTPKSCLTLDHLTRRHDMKFVIFDTVKISDNVCLCLPQIKL